MSNLLVLVEKRSDWLPEFAPVPVVEARDYLLDPAAYKTRGMRVLNLCRGYKYLSTGYYCSLLAEARRHRVIPNVHTLANLAGKSAHGLDLGELDKSLRKAISMRPEADADDRFESLICFGRSQDTPLKKVARQLFDLYPAPLLRVRFRKRERWQLQSVKPARLDRLNELQRDFFARGLSDYLARRWRKPRARSAARYDIAILHNPDEDLPPSDMPALQQFIAAGRALGADVELIRPQDYNRLAEFDALFIRETTNIDHHTYRFARAAQLDNIVVIDDPESIVKCTNKIYLTEILRRNRVPIPRSAILRRGEPLELEQQVGLPAVLKIPDGSFSRGVFKADTVEQALSVSKQLFRESALILAQEFLYTPFDWRIGVLNGEPLFACKYFMSDQHWQIVQHRDGAAPAEGDWATLPVEEVPAAVMRAALAAARLIGSGFYGVDLKQDGERVVVIEVNDNPNVEVDVEDRVLGKELYKRIMATLIHRVDRHRRA